MPTPPATPTARGTLRLSARARAHAQLAVVIHTNRTRTVNKIKTRRVFMLLHVSGGLKADSLINLLVAFPKNSQPYYNDH